KGGGKFAVGHQRVVGRGVCRRGIRDDRGQASDQQSLSTSQSRRNRRVSHMARKDALQNMRQILIKRRDALRQALAGDLSLLKELRAQTAGDLVDAALDSAQDEISSQLAEVESRELASVENALERMRRGQYGVCEGCGMKIPMARLNALP